MDENANSLLAGPEEMTAQPAAPAPEDGGQVTEIADERVTLEQRDIPWQRKFLSDIALLLKNGKPVPPSTVRNFLKLFWYSQRRGRWIVSLIRERLAEFELITVPDFESTYLDAEIEFQLAPRRQIATGEVGHEPIAITEVSAIEASAPLFADPTYRISKLAAANRIPTSIRPDATLTEAVTLMMVNDFSQLPVMTSEREVKGMVSWNSIGTRLALRQTPQWVREVTDPHAEVISDASFFNAIPVIVEHGYALVRSSTDKRITGIITTSDLSLQFQQLSEPFLLLGEIENHIRRIINGKFSKEELANAKDGTDAERSVESAADLTFGEYKRLLEDTKRWAALNLDIDRGVFIQRLDRVREIRNDVMHFDPDGIEDESLLTLRDFSRFLRTLQTIGAT
jgi:CBS domain-containing protein